METHDHLSKHYPIPLSWLNAAVPFKQHFRKAAVSTGAQEIASHRSSGGNWVSTRYMEDTFLDQSGTLGSHQSSLKTGFHPPGHSSVLQNGISARNQLKFVPGCKTDPQSQLWALREAAIDPDKLPKEGHLKRTPHPWMTEVQGAIRRKAQLQTQELQVPWTKQASGAYYSCEDGKPRSASRLPQQARLTKKKNQYSCPTSIWFQSFWDSLALWRGGLVFHKLLHSQAVEGHWGGSQQTWVLGLALLQMNFLTQGLCASFSSLQCRGGAEVKEDLSKAQSNSMKVLTSYSLLVLSSSQLWHLIFSVNFYWNNAFVHHPKISV